MKLKPNPKQGKKPKPKQGKKPKPKQGKKPKQKRELNHGRKNINLTIFLILKNLEQVMKNL